MASIGSIISRAYNGFRGVDFLNSANSVDITRSPDALNVWKAYYTTQSNMIQTRPGFTKINTFDNERVNNFFYVKGNMMLVHQGNKLYLWENFTTSTQKTLIYSDMNENAKSQGLFFNKQFYILDGKNYLVFNPESKNISDVSNFAYIPETSVGRSPSGGGQVIDDINCLTGKRINKFVGDGTSKEYHLDTTEIDSVDVVSIKNSDGEFIPVAANTYSVNLVKGTITFNTAPVKPSMLGTDNVSIEFTKVVSGYKERITHCTGFLIYDNRLFFYGNTTYPNGVFHCSASSIGGNPAYISDLDYYEVGSDENFVKSLVAGNEVLWVLKEDSQNKDTIFYMNPSTDTNYGRVYPVTQGNVAIGCMGRGINYKDRILFMSKYGIEGFTGNISQEQSVSHTSSLVDPKLINITNYRDSDFVEYNGYLLTYINDEIYLADYRQMYQGIAGIEYEWYYWKLPMNITAMRTVNNTLYFSDENGNIYEFGTTNDDGRTIECYWTTPRDAFGSFNHLKTVNKRGSVLKMKNIQNGRVKVAVSTNKSPTYEWLKTLATTGFNWKQIDFDNLSFSSTDNTYSVFRAKRKKIIDVSLKLYIDDEVDENGKHINKDKQFGLMAISLEAFLGGYVKR